MTMNRRRFLVATSTVVGGAGVLAAAVPFIRYWTPSARAKALAAPVEVNLEALEPGQKSNAYMQRTVAFFSDKVGLEMQATQHISGVGNYGIPCRGEHE